MLLSALSDGPTGFAVVFLTLICGDIPGILSLAALILFLSPLEAVKTLVMKGKAPVDPECSAKLGKVTRSTPEPVPPPRVWIRVTTP